MKSMQIDRDYEKYRPDIDGLRAIAVLAVIAYHVSPNWMKGGFIGVDIFFVISGYLISKIILEDLDKGVFNFFNFYTRRVRRIFPSLIVILSGCFIFGFFYLFENEYKQLGKHIAASAGFISNFILWNEAGYFDNSAETKPLLHLWSLGIEEQFYIFWPLIVWFLYKRKFNILFISLIFLTITSFMINVYVVKESTVAAFFSPQTRFWELSCGSLLAYFMLYKPSKFGEIGNKFNEYFSALFFRKDVCVANVRTIFNFFSLLGLTLLLYGFWRIDKKVDYPGLSALFPVLGTVLIILAGPLSFLNRGLLSSKLLVKLGLISYPLYLWHWPLLSLARIIEGGELDITARLSIVGLSIFLAWLTYRFIEYPFRFGKFNRNKIFILLLFMVTIGLLGFATYTFQGLGFRSLNEKSYINSIRVPNRAEECFNLPYAYKKSGDWFCSLGDRNLPPKYFVYGDSHALHLLPAFEKIAIESKIGMKFTGGGACPSLLGIQSMTDKAGIEMYNCMELNERVFSYVKSAGIKNVVLVNRWTNYSFSLSRPLEFHPIARYTDAPIDKSSAIRDIVWAIDNTVSRYASIGVGVIFVEDNPQQKVEPRDIVRWGLGTEENYNKYSVTSKEHKDNQEFINDALRRTGAKTINFDSILCPNEFCPLTFNSKFLYYDANHLSPDGALRVYPILKHAILH